MVAAPKAVYSAMSLASTMIALAVLYIAQDALFLGIVQVVVYTGAVMMLFLFVVMLIGVDSHRIIGGNDSRATHRGRSSSASVSGFCWSPAIGNVSAAGFTGLAQANANGNVQGLAALIFTQISVGVRIHQGAAHHRRRGCHGAGPPRTLRTAQDST